VAARFQHVRNLIEFMFENELQMLLGHWQCRVDPAFYSARITALGFSSANARRMQ
jgi:hypothetical protein